MTETMMIEIRASVDEALKKLDEVTKELKDIGEQSKKSSKEMSDSMKSATRSAQLQVEAIKQVVSKLVELGKNSLEAQKNIAKLNAAFLASGSTTRQASETYKNLFRFMGDSGAATEAAQQLALITTNEKDLVQWTKILQGVYASMGSTLPVENLAEAANETINVGKVTGAMADALNWAGVSEDAFNEKLAQTASLAEREALVRSTLNGLYMNAANIYERNNQALLNYNASQAQMDLALARAGQAILPLMTAINNLATSLLNSLSPALAVVSQMLAILVGWITTAVGWITSFFSLFTGGKDSTKDVANNVSKVGSGAKSAAGGVGGLNKALDGAAKAAKELKKQTMGFDELNVVGSQTEASTGGGAAASGGGGGVSVPDLSALTENMPNLDEFNKQLEDARGKAEALLVLIGSVGAAIALWKLVSFIKDVDDVKTLLATLGAKIQMVSGVLLIVAGALLTIKGYSDAWVNGIDWANFGLILGGISLTIGGLLLAFGTVAAGVGALAAGIALIVIGIKDFVTNGYSMQNVLTILAGVIAVVVGVCLAFNAALLANPITWIVIAIAALVAAFVILWNECEGFRNFWIAVWEKVKQGFAAFVDSIQPLIDALVNAFKAAWELIKVIWNDYLVPLFQAAWEAIKIVWDFVKPYFAALWESIKQVFSVVKVYFEGAFKTAWEAIKVIWSAVVGYFAAIWDSIAGIFSVVKNVLQGNWQGAWDAIKGIVNTWKGYFSGVWDGIKKVFGSVKEWFTSTFSAAWTAIKNVFSTWGSFFSGLWDKIKNTFSKLGTSIGDAIGKAVKSGINGVISMIEKTINSAISLINGAIKLINKIPGVSVGTISKLSLPRLAKGGIVDSATIAMIGERGKEAVVPLENNTEWMDKLADRLAARSNAPSKIILMVDGKELGWASVNGINKITKQTGTIPLQFA